MNARNLSGLVFTALACLTLTQANGEVEIINCRQGQSLFAPSDSPDYRKYAPSREIDILHLALDVTPDFKQRTIAGKVTLRFKPIAKPFSELKLDGIDLTVSSVTSTEKILGWQATDKNVIVTFEPPL